MDLLVCVNFLDRGYCMGNGRLGAGKALLRTDMDIWDG